MKTNFAYIARIAFVAAIGGFLMGFCGSIISTTNSFSKIIFSLKTGTFLSDFSISSIIYGTIIGCLFAGILSDKIGRKPTLLISALFAIISGLLYAITDNINIFIIARILSGLGIGLSFLVAPVYIAEIAPSKQRGFLVLFYPLLIIIGFLTAHFSNYLILKTVIDQNLYWHLINGIEVIPAIIYFIALFFIPESPKWFIIGNRENKNLNMMAKLRIEKHSKNEHDEIKNHVQVLIQESLFSQAKKIFSKQTSLKITIGIGLAILQGFSGISLILSNIPIAIESKGNYIDSIYSQTTVCGLIFLLTTISTMLLIDRLGRKPLLYIGVSLMALSLTFTGFTLNKASYQLTEQQLNEVVKSQKIIFTQNLLNLPTIEFKDEKAFTTAIDLAVIDFPTKIDSIKAEFLKKAIKVNFLGILYGIMVFIIGFSLSLGTVTWVILSEIFPSEIRGLAISIVGTVNIIFGYLAAVLFPIQILKYGSANTYFIYAGFMFLCLWFIWQYTTETKKKLLE